MESNGGSLGDLQTLLIGAIVAAGTTSASELLDQAQTDRDVFQPATLEHVSDI